jgi:hypothetical protein
MNIFRKILRIFVEPFRPGTPYPHLAYPMQPSIIEMMTTPQYPSWVKRDKVFGKKQTRRRKTVYVLPGAHPGEAT